MGEIRPKTCEGVGITFAQKIAQNVREADAIAMAAVALRTAAALSKIPSKIAKFHRQIVENRLEFRSKISPGDRHRDGVTPQLSKISVK